MKEFSPLRYAELAYPLYEQVRDGLLTEAEFQEKLDEAARLSFIEYPNEDKHVIVDNLVNGLLADGDEY